VELLVDRPAAELYAVHTLAALFTLL